MKKRGQANIITIVLLIILILIALVIVWNLVKPMIKTQSNRVNIAPFIVRMSLDPVPVYDPFSNCINISVRWDYGDVRVVGIRFDFKNSSGATSHYTEYNTSLLPTRGETKVIQICSPNLKIFNVNKVSFTPLFQNGNLENQYGIPSEEINVGTGSSCSDDCSSNGCDENIPFTCNDDNGDKCLEKTIGSACTSSQICIGNIGCVNKISQCGTISSPGIYYLNQSIVSTTDCLGIDANNVLIDCQNWNNKIIYGNQANGGYYGIGSDKINTTIRNCEIIPGSTLGTTNRWSIYLYRSNNSRIENVNTSNGEEGIYFDECSNNSLINVTASKNTFGIKLDYSNNNFLDQIIINNNSIDGIFLGNSLNNNLNGITADYNHYVGVDLRYSSYNNLTLITANANVPGGSSSGIDLRDGSNNNILNQISASSNEYGIFLESNSNNNRILLSQVCGNTKKDLNCSSSTTGNSGTGNRFTTINYCSDGWPVPGADYTSC